LNIETQCLQRKRKIADENRQFHNHFVQVKDNAICLTCHQSITTLKSYNLESHYEQRHNEIMKPNVSQRKAHLQLLKSDLNYQQNVYRRPTYEANAIVNASLRISQIIAIKMKAFSDGEYIKECLLAAVEEICGKKGQQFLENQCLISSCAT